MLSSLPENDNSMKANTRLAVPTPAPRADLTDGRQSRPSIATSFCAAFFKKRPLSSL
jgi:hypothetical protein